MVCLADNIILGRDMDNYKISVFLLDAFEMWVYRRVLEISWTEKITSEEV